MRKNKNSLKIHYIDHHISHIASAYYASNFNTALGLSIDGFDKFYNDELVDQDNFFKSFEKYCIENDFPLKINNKKMVINSIKAYIALQLFGENVFTMIMNQEDPFIQEALDHLNES